MHLPYKRHSLKGFTLKRTSLRENLVNVNRFTLKRTLLRRNFVNAHGFTLIELLVVIMTMGLLFGFGYANYRGFQRRQQLEGVVREFKTNLRLAQQLAITGKKEAGCVTLEGYAIVRKNNWSYAIEDRCSGGGGGTEIKTVNLLPLNISVGPFPPGNRFTFLVLTQGVDKTVTVTFTQLSTSDTKSVVITQSGEIK